MLAGNSQINGTQALGKVHNEVRQDILRFDAMLISASLYELIDETLKLNFSNVKPFKFALDANLEADENALSEVYERITSMGYEIPLEFMETAFKIKGLKFKGEAEAQISQNPDKKGVSKNAQRQNLPLDNIDAALESKEYNKSEKEILKEIKSSLNKLLKDASSYEEAFKKLGEMYEGMDIALLENAMINAVSNAEIYGYEDE